MTIKELAEKLGDNWQDISDILEGSLTSLEVFRLGQRAARINPRLTRCLGRVTFRGGIPVLELSKELATLGESKEIIEVFRHEVAHVATRCSIGFGEETAHGPTWRRFAVALGVPPSATLKASFESPGIASRKRVVAVCEKCDLELVRTQGLKRGRVFTHRRCGGVFQRKI